MLAWLEDFAKLSELIFLHYRNEKLFLSRGISNLSRFAFHSAFRVILEAKNEQYLHELNSSLCCNRKAEMKISVKRKWQMKSVTFMAFSVL